ncbi:MAG: archaemetzincin family Zn-dependent metalloprotease [Methanomicrobiales archaeon]|nr:archaemetzincin family Zn-dependent metalloprotease [Methanomicrobiales archaeon]
MAIRIVPIGSVDPSVLRMLQAELGRRFGQEVTIGTPVPLPDGAFDPRRGQYAAGILLNAAAERSPAADLDRTLAVADVDLYVPDLNFVFGLAARRTALFSLHRLRQSFYGRAEDRDLFHRRALTEAVHELGHTYGLPHSPDLHCVMYFSNTIADTDRKGAEFCEEDRKRLVRLGVIR